LFKAGSKTLRKSSIGQKIAVILSGFIIAEVSVEHVIIRHLNVLGLLLPYKEN
jgi:hypothetical protein